MERAHTAYNGRLRYSDSPSAKKPPAPCYETGPHLSPVGMICKGKRVEGDDSIDTGKYRNVECSRDFAKDSSVRIEISALHMEIRHTGRRHLLFALIGSDA